MGGILKNPLSQDEQELQTVEAESVTEFRQQVLKNTRLNAQLTSQKNSQKDATLGSTSPKKHGIPKDVVCLKREQEEEEKLQWNQQNLAENEIAKQQYQDIHVDEPKTPYQGAIDPDGEYYRQDDDELDSFSLGDPEFKVSSSPSPVIPLKNYAGEGGAVEGCDDDDDSGVENGYMDDPGSRRRKFEEMRKKHYNVKEVFKNQKISMDAEENDD